MSSIADRLRASVRHRAYDGDSAERSVCAKQMLEAAAEIERMHAQIAKMRRDHNAEIREIERDARHAIGDAVAEERWKAAQGDEYGSY